MVISDPAMQRLIDAKLFGDGLVPINTPLLVERYNACLNQLGIAPSTLQAFHVDGMGWSPEIAQEKGDNLYLSYGIANQLAIVISPDQEKRPVYFPFTSFDRRLMEQYFRQFIKEIVDVTATTAVALDIDQELIEYRSPRDLLLMDYIIVRSIAGDLMEAAREQRALVAAFNDGDRGWFDRDLREKLIESGKKFGDLRFRRVDIPDMRFDDLRSFHTRAFGGVFVLRDKKTAEDLLVLEDDNILQEAGGGASDVMGLHDPKLPQRLVAMGLVEVAMDWYHAHPAVLEEMKEYLIADALCSNDPELDYGALNPARKKKLVVSLGKTMPEAFTELERLIRRIKRAGVTPATHQLSPELERLLMRPRRDLPESLKDVLWQFILKLQPQPLDVLRLYASDKTHFFRRYHQWPNSKQVWAVEFIRERYVPLMNQ